MVEMAYNPNQEWKIFFLFFYMFCTSSPHSYIQVELMKLKWELFNIGEKP